MCSFVNTIIGYEEYLRCGGFLFAPEFGAEVICPVADELLDVFMHKATDSSEYYRTPYTLEYGGGSNSSGYSQSNGMGIDSTGLTSGTIFSYYWDTNSLMSQIYASLKSLLQRLSTLFMRKLLARQLNIMTPILTVVLTRIALLFRTSR